MAKSSKSHPIEVTVGKDSSVRVRQIENGYIVSESGTTGRGKSQKYYDKEFFSKINPLKISGGGMKFGGKNNG